MRTVTAGVLVVVLVGGGTLFYADYAAHSTPAPTNDSRNQTAEGDLNTTRVERLIHQEVNERRRARGLPALDYDSELAAIAAGHSRDMMRRGYFAHEAPNGSDFVDRYERNKYNCSIKKTSERVALGAENLMKTFYRTELEAEGDEYYNNASDLATGIVDSLMRSPGHRRNMLRPYWTSEGIGVAVTRMPDGDLKIYATQNFC